jgi:MipA family protein
VHKLLLITAACLVATPAIAQEDPTSPEAARRDSITIGVGGVITPRFEGAEDYTLSPGGALRGRVSGVAFSTVGTALFVDLVPSSGGPGTKFIAGPIAHLGLNRSSLKRIRDPQIVALGKIPVSVDVGGHVGLSRTGLITSDFDNLTLDVAVSHDVTSVHDSLIVTPSISYGTPLSTKAFVGISVSATHVGRGFAERYFGVTPAQSTASGLSVYTPGAGIKDVNFGVLGNLALSGNLRRGLSLFGIGSYAKLLGDFGRSPIVRDRNQFFGGLGLAYTF